MSQRTVAGVLAVPLLIGLWAAALFTPLPYVTYEPGITVDLLSETEDGELLQVQGHKTYRDDGEMLLTTVYVSRPKATVNLFEVVRAWIDDDDAVVPYDAVYDSGTTPEESEQRGAMLMATSQETAVAVALREAGFEVEESVQVSEVSEGMPAEGVLEVGDELLEVGGREVTSSQDVVDAVSAAPAGEQLALLVRRDGREVPLEVSPREVDGTPRLGIMTGYGFDLPFEVTLDVDPAIGGSSAGMMFALSVYDTLTPGSLTGGQVIAGTGTVDDQGQVGPIGGIAQKIAAARDEGARLFLVPPDNCGEALGADPDDMRLVRAETVSSALDSLERWVEDPDADLPRCERSSE
ncbi:YlbL family protein [Nocardioides campestrisoli]|uniref:YlbL family protein n=1 Tax=Nocardioides campestrisoli TaxID=2736757 RepID=UPI00163DACC5|nr:PDZ domain-containing protein [Nocardioides campestrisoli]